MNFEDVVRKAVGGSPSWSFANLRKNIAWDHFIAGVCCVVIAGIVFAALWAATH